MCLRDWRLLVEPFHFLFKLLEMSCHKNPSPRPNKSPLTETWLFTARDASEAFEACHHSIEAREMLRTFLIGNFLDVSALNCFLYPLMSGLIFTYDSIWQTTTYHR